MKNRYLLCILLTVLLLYYALPYLSLNFQTSEGIFSLAWLGFALLVFAGNLSAWLYAPKRYRSNQNQKKQVRKRVRSF